MLKCLLTCTRVIYSAIFSVFISFAVFGCTVNNDSEFRFDRMLVEYAENPITIDEMHPRFSWIISSSERKQVQSAYRIIVTSSLRKLKANKADIWDSGKIESGETIQHEYAPDNLKSDSQYFWKVIIWDGERIAHESPVSKFETAFLPGYDWSASWIGNGSQTEPLPQHGFYKDIVEQSGGMDSIIHDGNSLLLRDEVEIAKKIKSAKAYITGLGFYEFFINGKRVGDHVLAPAKTPYHKYVLYDSYDVTTLLNQGANAFGIHLGNGWYNPYKKWWNEYRMQWFGSKKTIARIRITFTDGTTQTITTNEKWLWAPGPVKYNCVYDGEVYDANLDHKGWTSIGYDDSEWEHVSVYNKSEARLVSHQMPAIKVNECFKPTEVKSQVAGMKVYDMGQNFSGWVRITARGRKNTIMKIRFAEDINTDGTIDITSNEYAKATTEYIMKGDTFEIYEPHFTYFGFKYVEITSINGPLDIIDVEGRAVYSDNPLSGRFECSNMLVNKIHKATVWSQKSNMMGYPMDCPQRDERLGWFGDAQVTAEEAMFNFNMALFYENWFEGIMENQNEKTGDIPIISPRPYIYDVGIEWSSTYLIMLWQYYNYYGDKRILSRHYPAMERYMNFLDSISKDKILPMGWIGDWGSMVDGWREGEPKSVPTAYYYLNAKVMSDVARVLGNSVDQEYYKNLSEDIRDTYNRSFLDTLTANYNDGSQMANSFPLYLGIVPENMKSRVLDNLVKDIVINHSSHLTTGVLGTKYLPEALVREGRSDVAWQIINQKSAPSWNDMMNRYTTMCEFWTLKQSKNHVMMGSIDAWFYKYIAGIQLDDMNPAFSSFYVKPMLLDSLGSSAASIETMRGTISSVWEKKSDLFSLNLEVPFNTTATVYIPGNQNDEVLESGNSLVHSDCIEYLEYRKGTHILKVNSGGYFFTIKN